VKVQQRNPRVVFDWKPAIGDSEIDPVSDAQEFDCDSVSVCVGAEMLEYRIRIGDGKFLVLERKQSVLLKDDVVNCWKRRL